MLEAGDNCSRQRCSKQRTEMFIFWARDVARGANAHEVLGSVPSTAKNKRKSFLYSQDVILMCISTHGGIVFKMFIPAQDGESCHLSGLLMRKATKCRAGYGGTQEAKAVELKPQPQSRSNNKQKSWTILNPEILKWQLLYAILSLHGSFCYLWVDRLVIEYKSIVLFTIVTVLSVWTGIWHLSTADLK